MHGLLRRAGAAALGLALATGLLTVSPTAALAESNGGVRVMPLGDSITDGFNVPGGYRINLWQRMAADRLTVDFVGSGFNGPAALGDHDHEGHSGWKIRDLDANITGWLQRSAPRTVLLHIGTNDINGNDDVGNAPALLSALIDKIRVLAPNVELFVATITPISDAAAEQRARTFNATIPGIVAQKGSRTHLVDLHAALTTADLADGLHPNAGGYDKMAARWYSALQSVPGSLTAVTVPPVGSPALLSHGPSTRCLDISGGTTDGSQALIRDCHGGANQRFTRTAAGELKVLDRCLDVNGSGTANGTKVQLWTCNGTGAQRFTANPDGSLVNTNSLKCIDVSGNGTANGTLVQLYECNGTGAQRWTVR
ncbi:ricin-type beta-trefoil lectin domain protein [Actinoplanes friuliensis]|uniref:Polypeptide N-acetylgalactosaminyltransferase 13 n=1 Tax=Actinoplanes friuliensis DSM 7358 TaxID=1246995 RepID=U5VWJ5_9ACTN|nr:ricin-type beta-trefoil lectin domain protein [Actinoplanes friuliensis]AGZ41378.1 Polypeptide N-acetylgalactosaminyltransferase 13 [Actinoplanes friuliensis DSM 7358]